MRFLKSNGVVRGCCCYVWDHCRVSGFWSWDSGLRVQSLGSEVQPYIVATISEEPSDLTLIPRICYAASGQERVLLLNPA